MGLTGALRDSRCASAFGRAAPSSWSKATSDTIPRCRGVDKKVELGQTRRWGKVSGQRGAPSDLSVSSPQVPSVSIGLRSCCSSVTLDRISVRPVRRPLRPSPCWLRRPSRIGVPNLAPVPTLRVSSLRRSPLLRSVKLPDLSGHARIYRAPRGVSIPNHKVLGSKPRYALVSYILHELQALW